LNRGPLNPTHWAIAPEEGPMLAFELVGMALFALFFGALITNKESVSR
jgi:hypothetical protein